MTTPRKYTAVYDVLRNDNVLSLMARLGRIMPQFLPIMLFLDSSIFTYYAYQYVPIILNIMLKITIFLTMIILYCKKTEASI